MAWLVMSLCPQCCVNKTVSHNWDGWATWLLSPSQLRRIINWHWWTRPPIWISGLFKCPGLCKWKEVTAELFVCLFWPEIDLLDFRSGKWNIGEEIETFPWKTSLVRFVFLALAYRNLTLNTLYRCALEWIEENKYLKIICSTSVPGGCSKALVHR